jgi:hypothetical protein
MSARAGIYAVRHQRAGIVTETMYTVEPRADVLATEKARLDQIYGPGWIRVVPVALELAPEHEDLAARFAAPPEPPAPAATDGGGALPGLVIRATGELKPR